MSEFRVLNAADPQDFAAWLQIFEGWPEYEPHAHPAYVLAFAAPGETALCAVSTCPQGAAFMPIILRPFDESFDLTTPYGYGGPFAIGDPPSFWPEFNGWAQRQKVVSLVARLSLFDDKLLPFDGQTREVMKNVVRSLDLPEGAMWMDFEHKVRKNVKKAERSGVSVVSDQGERLADFLRIYTSTLDRRQADEGFYFDERLFRRLLRDMPGQLRWFHALLDGQVVSTELVLVGAQNVYSFLGGTDSRHFDARPNDLLKVEIIRWARSAGKKNFVLGGGYGAEDGIYKYKLSFAPSGERPFRIGAKIFEGAAYDALVDRRKAADPSWSPREGFFPAYRSGPAG